MLCLAGYYTIGRVIDTCTLLNRVPTPGEHRGLSEAVGWAHAFEWETMAASLKGSLAGVVALDGSQVIGMGRLVGDGVKYFYVQDLAVLPAYQGRGIGTALLQRLWTTWPVLRRQLQRHDGHVPAGQADLRLNARST